MHLESEQHELWKIGFLAATMHNAAPRFGKGKRKAVKPEDLIPALKPGKAGKKGGRKAQTPDEMLFLARTIHARYQAAKRVKDQSSKGPAVRKPRGPNKG